MALKHVLKISSINEFFENDNKIIKKGENALESSHVKQMIYDAELLIIRGKIRASMKDKMYTVEIHLNKAGEITSASCSCPRGIKCHHISTLALFGHYNISVTDKECTWNAPKTQSQDLKTAAMLYPSKVFKAVDRQITESEMEGLRNKLSNIGNTVGFTWLLRKERESDDINYLPIIENIISSDEFIDALDKVELIKQKCCIDDAAIEHIAEITTGQAKNEIWAIIRKFRVTASNFGMILDGVRRNKFTESLFKTLIGSYNLDGVKAIQWGRSHENNGLEYIQTNFNVDIKQTGIWLLNSGVIGASPDGLIGDHTIVEVKCPYRYRNEKISDVLKSDKNYIIYFNDSGEVVVNPTHNYYHQIQGNLYLTKRKQCFLCIWTTQEAIAVNIDYNPLWADNIRLLEEFYFNHYLPRLTAM